MLVYLTPQFRWSCTPGTITHLEKIKSLPADDLQLICEKTGNDIKMRLMYRNQVVAQETVENTPFNILMHTNNITIFMSRLTTTQIVNRIDENSIPTLFEYYDEAGKRTDYFGGIDIGPDQEVKNINCIPCYAIYGIQKQRDCLRFVIENTLDSDIKLTA